MSCQNSNATGLTRNPDQCGGRGISPTAYRNSSAATRPAKIARPGNTRD